MSLQDNIVKIDILQNLLRAGNSPEDIPKILGIHRATVYRWMKRIQISGIRQFKKDYKEAKKGRRIHNKTHGSIRAHILQIRKERRDCCGEKIAYFLEKEGVHDVPSQSTIYRILGTSIKLRSSWKKNSYRGDVPKGARRGEVIQIDTVHFENIFAFTAIDTYTKEPFVQLSTECTAKEGERFVRRITKYYEDIHTLNVPTGEYSHTPIPIGLIQRDGGPEFKGECESYIRRYRNIDGSEIKLRTARPYKKNEQAFIERFNGILRKESLGYANYSPKDLPILEKELQSYLHYYLTERPHISLGMIPPMEFIQNLTLEPKETEKK